MLYTQGQAWIKAWHFLAGIARRKLLLLKVHQFDLIFLHREALPVGPPILEFCIARIFGKKIIYDFDDAIWLPNTSEQNSIAARLKWHGKVKSICRWSWRISCGNAYLATFAKKWNADVIINPTTIDTNYHRPQPKSHTRPAIGWTGTHSTSKYLSAIEDVLNGLKGIYDFEIIIISNQKPDWAIDDYQFIPWSKSREIEALNRIDIGVMPLANTPWELGKCGFKALQYMAMEIPAVASNVGVNSTIIDQGVSGYLCETKEEWIKYLGQLLESMQLRKRIGQAGRNKVRSHYSVEANTDLFLNLFE
jgi:glycosyltransferase involved in cell wall biosynthesis